MKITRALSIRQPFAEQIMSGEKKIEYRTIPTNIRERVYIYASKKVYEDDFDAFEIMHDVNNKNKLKDLPRGKIIGTVEIVNCEAEYEGDVYSWHLANPKRLKRFLKPKNKPQPVWFKPF